MNPPNAHGIATIDEINDYNRALRDGLSDEPQNRWQEVMLRCVERTLRENFGFDLADENVGRLIVGFIAAAGPHIAQIKAMNPSVGNWDAFLINATAWFGMDLIDAARSEELGGGTR